MFWGAGQECRLELVIDATETDDASLVGEAAHIVAEQPEGPRGDPSFPIEKRNKYDNLILLCNLHHKQVDDQVNKFSVERLHALKAEHERWVRDTLATFDAAKQADDERWAAYVEEWVTRARLDDWYNETYGLLQPIPYISHKFLADLHAIPEWLLSRVWPNRYSDLRRALECFRNVANDLVNTFERHSIDDGDRKCTEQFYKIREYDPQRYDFLAKRFDFHVDLVQDLTFEMTRAANYVCDMVRSTIDPSFRISEGVLLLRGGVEMDWQQHTYRTEYRPDELTVRPYPGLKEFLHLRASRDISFGEGEDPTSGSRMLL